jgi:peroxygenase
MMSQRQTEKKKKNKNASSTARLEQAKAISGSSDKETMLIRHASYFDFDKDGYISIYEMYKGFKSLGFSFLAAVFAAIMINFPLAWWTSDRWWPTLSIRLEGLYRIKHGSDSGTFDHEGNFNEPHFERLWERYDVGSKGYWTWDEIKRMMKDRRDFADPCGMMAVYIEWRLLWSMAAKDGKLTKEDVIAQYDGTLFYRLAQERAAKKSTSKKNN